MICDLSALPPAVVEQIAKLTQSDFAVKAQAAIAEQKAVADHYDRNRPRAIDGVGGMTMALHPLLQWEAGVYFKDGNWDRDPEKVKWYLNRNPAARVRHAGTKVQVGYSGAGGQVSGGEGEISNRRSRTVFAEPETRNEKPGTRNSKPETR